MNSRFQRAVFLDRDGVINIDHGYVHRIEDFEFRDGIFDLCRRVRQLGFEIIVVTNQAGIARDFYTEKDFASLTTWMVRVFQKEGVLIRDVLYCPFHEEGLGKYKRKSEHRKPNPGMLLDACRKHNIRARTSIIVGDQETDMQAGRNAGIGLSILVDNGIGPSDSPTQADFSFCNLKEVETFISRNDFSDDWHRYH